MVDREEQGRVVAYHPKIGVREVVNGRISVAVIEADSPDWVSDDEVLREIGLGLKVKTAGEAVRALRVKRRLNEVVKLGELFNLRVVDGGKPPAHIVDGNKAVL